MSNETTATAWVLIERGLNGKERTEGIALTNEDAIRFLRGWFLEGCARNSLPYKVISYREEPSNG